MQLTSPAAPLPAPTRIVVSASTTLDEGPPWGLTSAEHVDARFDASGAAVTAHRDVHDALWDGPVAEPADPRDWSAARSGSWSPALASALDGLRASVNGTDLSRIDAAPMRPGTSYANIQLTWPARPAGIDHLAPRREADGGWTVSVRTSLDDLFQEQRLQPIVDAARLVLAAAR